MFKIKWLKSNWLIALLCTACVLFWSLATPIFEFPDEQAHLSSVEYLKANGHMPVRGEPDMTEEMYEAQSLLGVLRDERGNNHYTYHPEYNISYSSDLVGIHETEIASLARLDLESSYVATEAAIYPPSYYNFLAGFTNYPSSISLIDRLFKLRLISLIFVFLTALFTYQIGLIIFAKKTYAGTLTLMVMLQPMFSFLSAGINSDNLHNLLFTVIIYGCLRLLKEGMTLPVLATLLLSLILDFSTKPQAMIGVPIIAMAVVLYTIKVRQFKLVGFSILVLPVLLYVTKNQWGRYLPLLVTPNIKGVQFLEFLKFSLNKLVTQNSVWYWGVFKWLGVVLPPLYWQIANRLVLISAIGLIIYFFKYFKKRRVITNPYLVTFLALATFLYIIAIYWYDWQYHKRVGYSIGVQARYFFPVIVAQISLLFIGIISLGWSRVSRLILRRALVCLFILLQLGGLWRLLSSYYNLSSLNTFIVQVSQYKPDFAKGNFWYLWIGLYLVSLLSLAIITFGSGAKRAK